MRHTINRFKIRNDREKIGINKIYKNVFKKIKNIEYKEDVEKQLVI